MYDDARHVTAGDVATHLIPESGNRFTPGATYTLMVQATKSGADYSQPSADATVGFKGWVVVSSTAVDVAEPAAFASDNTGTYTVRLGTNPTQDVTVTITRKAGTHQSRPAFDTDTITTGDQATLTFTSSNGTTAQTVTISVSEDRNDVNTESTTLVHTATSTDANYTSITAPEVVARAVDGNAPTHQRGRVLRSERADSCVYPLPRIHVPGRRRQHVQVAHHRVAAHRWAVVGA